MLFLFAATLHQDQLQNGTIVECNTVTAAMVKVHAEACVCQLLQRQQGAEAGHP